MKPLTLTIIATFALASCAPAEPPTPLPPTNDYAATGSPFDPMRDYRSGFTYTSDLGINYREDIASHNLASDLDYIYTEVQACTGLWVADPILAVVLTEEVPVPFAGYYHSNVILLLPYEQRSIMIDLLRHEVIHFLLHTTYGSLDPDHNEAALYSACSPRTNY